jgi:hypothetical protein
MHLGPPATRQLSYRIPSHLSLSTAHLLVIQHSKKGLGSRILSTYTNNKHQHLSRRIVRPEH